MSLQEEKLKEIANAIRFKENSNDPIIANDFAARILNLPSGGLPANIRKIVLSMSNPEGGSVKGGGLVQDEMTVTISAEQAEKYLFRGWQEDGVIVTEEPLYTFEVAKDRTLIGIFEESHGRLPEEIVA